VDNNYDIIQKIKYLNYILYYFYYKGNKMITQIKKNWKWIGFGVVVLVILLLFFKFGIFQQTIASCVGAGGTPEVDCKWSDSWNAYIMSYRCCQSGTCTSWSAYDVTPGNKPCDQLCDGVSCPDICIGQYKTVGRHCYYGECVYLQPSFCPNGCSNGQCISSECTPGYLNVYQCDGSILSRQYQNSDCSKVWYFVQDCCPPNQECKTCSATEGKCISSGCTDECSPSGARTCVDSTHYKVCGNYDSDSCLEWSSTTSCPSGQTCSNGQCVQSCTPKTCQELGKSCGMWSDGCGGYVSCGDCGEGQVCSNEGVCVTKKECEANEKGCSSETTRWECVNYKKSYIDCPSDYVCNGGICTSSCVSKSCSELGFECGYQKDNCGKDLNCGSCPSGKTCENGKCVDENKVICSPTEKECYDNATAKICVDNAWTYMKCSSNEVCSNGECVVQKQPNILDEFFKYMKDKFGLSKEYVYGIIIIIMLLGFVLVTRRPRQQMQPF